MPNTNFQTIHQMGSAISNVVKQATGRDPVENIDMDYVTVAQNKTIGEMVITGNPAEFHTGNAVPIQRMLIGMNPIQSGSGDPSPENIRPITGRTGVNVTANGTTIPVTFPDPPGTVYGGTLDLISGVLTVNMTIKILSQSDSFSISIGSERNRISVNSYAQDGKINGTFVSDVLETTSNSSGGYSTKSWAVWGSTSAPRMWISVPSEIDTVENFKAYLESNSISIVYELAEPLTYQLTPQEIQTIAGDNVVYTDGDTLEVMYYQYGEVI